MSSKISSFDLKNSETLTEKNYVPNSSESFRIFPSCPEKEIVISGIAGRYPNCDNVDEFRHHLFNKVRVYKSYCVCATVRLYELI